jgi:hypothetical protein
MKAHEAMKTLRFSPDPKLDTDIASLYRQGLIALSSHRESIEREYEKRKRVWNELGIFNSVNLLRAFNVPLPGWARTAEVQKNKRSAIPRPKGVLPRA